VQSTGLLAAERGEGARRAAPLQGAVPGDEGRRGSRIATAACRDATNGPDFIARAERICGVPSRLSGAREARLSALGVASGVYSRTASSATSAAARSN